MPRKKSGPHYYIINEFRKAGDDRFWKLHWFGQLDFNLKNREPLIETTLVPLADPNIDPQTNPLDLLSNDAYDFEQKRTVNVGVGQLPLFGIGVFFQHGRPVSRPSFTRREFKEIFIGDRTWNHIKAREILESNKDSPADQEISRRFDEYQLEGMNLEAKCLSVRLPRPDVTGVTKLIIPCVELVRFHYASSSEMLREIFTGGAIGTPNRVFNAARTIEPDAAGHNGYVQLSKFITDKDAPFVARMAFNPYALAVANHIYKSTLTSYNNEGIKQYIPEARFPFTGVRVTLEVHGQVIRSGAERHFLVFWIERCNGLFPFQTFEYDRDNNGIKVDTDPNRPYASWPHPPKKDYKTVRDRTKEEVIRSDVEPSSLKKLIKQLLVKKKFANLEKKDWWKRKKSESKYQARPSGDATFVHSDEETHTLSAAPAEGASPVTPLSLATDVHPGDSEAEPGEVVETKGASRVASRQRAPTLPASFDLFLSIVAALNEPSRGITCEVVEVGKGGGIMRRSAVSHFPEMLGDDPLSFSNLTLPDGSRRPRGVLMAEGVCRGARYFYLMEIEPQPPAPGRRVRRLTGRPKGDGSRRFTLFLCHGAEPFAPLGGDTLRKVLALCAKHRGAWPQKHEVPDLGIYKLKHGSSSVGRYVERIKEKLQKGKLLA